MELASFDPEQYKFKNKRKLLYFGIIGFLLVLPVIIGLVKAGDLNGIRPTGGVFDIYLEILFVLALLTIPVGLIVYGIYAFRKREIFTRLGSLDFRITGIAAQVLATLLILVIVGWIFYTGFHKIIAGFVLNPYH